MAATQSSKGQVQMMESMMVLLIFIILLIVGLVFFWNMTLRDIGSSAQSLTTERYTVLTTVFPHLPEVSYSDMTYGRNYIDTSKLIPFKETITKNPDHYFALFGSIKITIEQIYPEPSVKDKECSYTEYKAPAYPDNCDHWVLYDRLDSEVSRVVVMPVSLYFPSLEEWRIGRVLLNYPQ